MFNNVAEQAWCMCTMLSLYRKLLNYRWPTKRIENGWCVRQLICCRCSNDSNNLQRLRTSKDRWFGKRRFCYNMIAMAIESLFTYLLAFLVGSFFVRIGMRGQPVMKNDGGSDAECKHDQHESRYNFLYGLLFIQKLIFATRLQIYSFLNKKKIFTNYPCITHLG